MQREKNEKKKHPNIQVLYGNDKMCNIGIIGNLEEERNKEKNYLKK